MPALLLTILFHTLEGHFVLTVFVVLYIADRILIVNTLRRASWLPEAKLQLVGFDNQVLKWCNALVKWHCAVQSCNGGSCVCASLRKFYLSHKVKGRVLGTCI